MMRIALEVPDTPFERVLDALTAIFDGPGVSAIRFGFDQDGDPIIGIDIDDRRHILYPDDARAAADFLVETMLSDPDDCEVAANLIMTLRAAADETERLNAERRKRASH
jgi:hypothetical protein